MLITPPTRGNFKLINMKIRQIKIINLDTIRKLDRYPIVPQTLDLANKLISRKLTIESLPPIHTKMIEGTHIILDGRHRYTAIRLAGLTQIKSKFYG